jgi:hypothetical protein
MDGKKSTKPQTPDVCPVCSEDVPRGALACPECGADHSSGWREDTDAYDALDLPDEDFNYEKFVQEEFGSALKAAGAKTVLDFHHRSHRCSYRHLLLRRSLNTEPGLSARRLCLRTVLVRGWAARHSRCFRV